MPTDKSTWKRLESRVCQKFSGKRTPLSGSNSQHGTSADCIETSYPWLYIEVKLRASFLHHTIFKQAAKAAQKENKTPILVTHAKNEDSELVTVKIEDFLEIVHSRKVDEKDKRLFYKSRGNTKE